MASRSALRRSTGDDACLGAPNSFAPRPRIAYRRQAEAVGNYQSMAGGVLAGAFMANQAALLRYLRARGAGDDSEDCLQELWIRAEASVDQLVADPLAYLYRMAHNLMLDRHRTAHRRQNREQCYRRDVQGCDGDADDAPVPERILIGRERLRQIDRVLAGLGQRTEYIFRRHRVDEIGQREIARELGITLSAIEKHLQKAYRAVAAAQRALADGHHPNAATQEHVRGRP